jgi:hypothetical protein
MEESQIALPNWQLDGTRAYLCAGGWTAGVDLTDAISGVAVKHATIDESSNILGVAVPTAQGPLGPPTDWYAREGDLVAIYPEAKNRPFRVTIYWSTSPPTAGIKGSLQFDLVISVQTEQLGIEARVDAISRVPARCVWASADAEWSNPRQVLLGEGEALELNRGSFLPAILVEIDPTHSYLESVAEIDFLGCTVSRARSSCVVRQRLLDEIMEKGVIRRVRVRGLLFAGPQRFELPADAYRRFTAEKLPLTT